MPFHVPHANRRAWLHYAEQHAETPPTRPPKRRESAAQRRRRQFDRLVAAGYTRRVSEAGTWFTNGERCTPACETYDAAVQAALEGLEL